MHRLAVLLLVLVALVLILAKLLLQRDPSAGGIAGPPDRGAPPAEAPAPAHTPTEPAVADGLDGGAGTRTALTEPALEGDAVEVQEPRCVVLGTVEDQAGAPIVDAAVRLAAYKVWTEGLDVPRLEGRYDMRGFETRTDEAGAFRIEAPPPTATRTVLTIRPGRFHDSLDVRFDGVNDRSRPPLAEGVRDLGVIRLANTGAVQGRVTDQNGAPLADMEVGIGPEPSITYGRDTRTAPDGTYVVAHAPVGTYGVKARGDGFLSGFQSPVTVEERRDTTGIDFVLLPAPSIEGTVADESGQPLAGAKLWGWPVSSGRGAGARSDEAGRFILYLPQEEPYSLSVSLDGYEKWGNEHDKSVTFAPGQRGVEVVMVAMALTRFLVVDAETREPIGSFGLNILEDNGSRAPRRVGTERRRPPLREHAGGVAEASARPGIDVYVVAADGYLMASGDVEHGPGGQPQQTVLMRRGATLLGRVFDGGEAVVAARVEVERGSMRSNSFRARSNTLCTGATDAEGRFAVTALERGVHRLVVRAPGKAALVVAPIEIRSGDVDLGDLALQEGGSIRGRVLVPAGVDPGGLRVYLDDWRDDVKVVTDASGAFLFSELAPGIHTVLLDERPGELAATDPLEVDVPSGETADVVLDAQDRGTCSVRLTLELGELSPEGLQVDLAATGESYEHETLGKCDEAGVIAGAARGWGEAAVVVWLPGSNRVEHPERLILRAGEDIDRTLRFDFAGLRLVLPGGVRLPQDGFAQLRLVPAPPATQQRVKTSYSEGQPTSGSPDVARDTGDGILYGCLLPGSYELTLDLVDKDAELVQVPVGETGYRIEPRPYYRAIRDVHLVAGDELTLPLE